MKLSFVIAQIPTTWVMEGSKYAIYERERERGWAKTGPGKGGEEGEGKGGGGLTHLYRLSPACVSG